MTGVFLLIGIAVIVSTVILWVRRGAGVGVVPLAGAVACTGVWSASIFSMNPLEGALLVVYVLVLVGVMVLSVRMASGGFAGKTGGAPAACAACAFGALPLASLATPDWSPISMAFLVLPFWLLALGFGLTARRASA